MKTVIVIDDNIDTLTVIQLILSAEGYRVLSYSNWKDGVNKIHIIKPSIIMIDVNLGTADGRNLAKQLKYQKETSNIPIILFSANHNVVNNLSECEADEFIGKPIKMDALIEKIRSLTLDK